jgi:hypothetical protein
MNNQDKINFIREKCIAANPEIVELKFGCEVETTEWNEYDSGRRFIVADTAVCLRHKKYREECYDDFRCSMRDAFAVIRIEEEEGFWYEKFKPSELKPLGRPISLADVLLAKFRANLNHMGGVMSQDYSSVGEAVAWWNLHADDLEKQSEETINFLAELLT